MPEPRLRINLAAATVQGVPRPPGAEHPDAIIMSTTESQLTQQKKHKADIMAKRAMETGLAPGKNIFMQGFMMYMSGNGVQIFSVMMVGGGVWNPVKAIMRSCKTFERFSDANTDMTGPRLAFCAIQVAGLAMALYKLNAMGLLPTHASDWVSGMKPPRALEHAFGGTTL